VTFAYSVVIPAHNAAATIAETIASITAQTMPPLAIILVDDGSTDGTAAVALACPGPVSVVAQANGGPGAATTAGFRRVTTPFFATLDADDLWLPHKIAVQAGEFTRDPELAGVFSLAREFIDGQAADPDGPGTVRRLWTRTTMLLRTEAALEVGDFHDFPGRLGEVIDWLSRSHDLGHRYVMVEEVLAMRRVRAGSLSHGLDAERARGYLVAVHNALKRRAGADKGEAETRDT
jgi:glycosyltransferase involved in cell wall biosynthesis